MSYIGLLQLLHCCITCAGVEGSAAARNFLLRCGHVAFPQRPLRRVDMHRGMTECVTCSCEYNAGVSTYLPPSLLHRCCIIWRVSSGDMRLSASSSESPNTVHRFGQPSESERYNNLLALSVGGEIMLQAWAFEQASDSKRSFETQDTMVAIYTSLHQVV